MEQPLPAWAYTAWWKEFGKETPQYRHRLYDFINMRKRGVPVVMMKGDQVVGVEVAAPKDCEKEVDFGHPQAPDLQIVCRYCGQRKDEFLEFSAACARKDSHRGTRTHGRVRTIDPSFPDCCADCDYSSNWVWTQCVHVRAWKDSGIGSTKAKRFIDNNEPTDKRVGQLVGQVSREVRV